LNRRVLINGANATIVGVVPANFRFPNWNSTIWMPVDFGSPPAVLSTTLPRAVARLSQSMPVSDAMRIAAETAHAADPATRNLFAQADPLAGAPPDDYVRRAAPFLGGGVALVFIVICANASSLLLARLTARSREFSVRAALGASRARLVRETLIESSILGFVSVAAGVGIAASLVVLARGFLPEAFLLRTLNPIELDFRALTVASASGLTGALAAALLPALLATRSTPVSALRSFERSGSSRSMRAAARGLLVTEIALACVLLVGATLLVRSFLNLSNADRGLNTAAVITAWVTGLPGSSSDRAAREAASSAIESSIRSLPGVRSVALSFGLPPGRGSIHFGDGWQSDVPGAPALNLTVQSYNVGADFFDLYGIPILRGRSFQSGDPPESVIVGERLAALLWPGLDPTGRSFTWEGGRYDVIGVTREIHLPTLDQRLDRPEFYRPFSTGAGQFMMSIRCNATCPDAALVRKRIIDAGSDIRVANVGPLESEYLAQTSRPRAAAALGFTFAAISLLAATGGLFSVLSYAVRQRGREFGIRFAVGARPAEVRRLVFRETAAITAAGLVLGCLVAWWFSRSLSALTYGIAPGDLSTWIFVTAVIALTVTTASWRPAAQASRVDPVALLKEE
jgi:predicted permease